MLIGKKLASAAGIVPLVAGLLAVAGPATLAHASANCQVPFIVNDPAVLADNEIYGAGLQPRHVWNPTQDLPVWAYVVGSTSPVGGRWVECGSTVSYTWKVAPLGEA